MPNLFPVVESHAFPNLLFVIVGHRKTAVKHHDPLRRVHTISKHFTSPRLEKEKKVEAKKRTRDKNKEKVEVLPRIKERHNESHDHDELEGSRDSDIADGRGDSTPEVEQVERFKQYSQDHKDGEKSRHHHHKRRHHHHHRNHHHRTISEREQLESRLRSGALTLQETEPQEEVTEVEENLPKKDLEEIACEQI